MRYIEARALDPISRKLLDSYAALPPDPYLHTDDRFRFRAFGEATVGADAAVTWDEEAHAFYQDDSINEYAGGVQRRFAPLSGAARDYAAALITSPEVAPHLPPGPYRLGCHQIRITAEDGKPGLPAPEGFHQDGFDLVAVACIASENVSGGISLLRDKEADGDILLEHTMAPGEVLLFVDPQVMHYVSPITPKVPGVATHRDMVVLTFDLSAAQGA
ncbi:2OG-Fe dioxygenase family protein [Streptomyces venezuelae]|uniref:2OG-Fe dioxygenase family protein n=1 Tax=Streptomyces venezuelae TaxID=54571 RepID=UPI00379194E2